MEAVTTKAAATANAKKGSTGNKGGNDGKTPRALRGAPKAAVNWTPADEARFNELEKNRLAFVAERTQTLKQALGLLFKGAKAEIVNAVTDGEGKLIAEAQTFPAAITEEALLANLADNGDAVLTYLSKHYKLVPTLIKDAH